MDEPAIAFVSKRFRRKPCSAPFTVGSLIRPIIISLSCKETQYVLVLATNDLELDLTRLDFL